MPEVDFVLDWPDGTRQACTSPSTAIEAWFAAGASYPVPEALRRAREGLEAASERVREAYGMRCTAAAAQLEEIERLGAGQEGRVTVASMAVRGHAAPRRAPQPLDGHRDVVVVGGGQAGLSMSWQLTQRGIDHVVLEQATATHAWRDDRWDAFCLVTPNWQCRLPGFPYAGDDPDGFMVRSEILEYLAAFRGSFDPPVHEGVRVEEVAEADGGGFAVRTSAGELHADQVVLAVGGYHRPRVPALAAHVDPAITQLHTSAYRNAASLPDGAVLVVGTGQSGAQIAEDLHLEGREVHVCVGSAPRVARFYRGRDCVAWLQDIGHYDMPVGEHREGERQARHEPNHYVTGRDGGRDIDLRRFATEGMRLHGRLTAVDGTRLELRGDLAANLDAADATMERIKATIDAHIEAKGIDAPAEAGYVPVWEPEEDGGGLLDLQAEGITTVLWATGYSTDWSWVRLPAFDGTGYPVHERGVTSVEGLHVLGLPWLHTWGSGRFAAIDRDSAHLAEQLVAGRASRSIAA